MAGMIINWIIKKTRKREKFKLVREIEDVERFVKLVWDLITENCYLDALWYIVGTLAVCSRMMFNKKQKRSEKDVLTLEF